jgi:hypothetical protein
VFLLGVDGCVGISQGKEDVLIQDSYDALAGGGLCSLCEADLPMIPAQLELRGKKSIRTAKAAKARSAFAQPCGE